MANLPLAFAEILAGGILLTAGITNTSISNVVQGDAILTAAPFDTGTSSTSSSSSSASSGTSAGSGSGSGASSADAAAYANVKGQGGVTPTSFASALLNAIGAPLSNANIQSIVDWEAREGGNWENTARYNPLNTTEPEPGYSETGTQGNIGSYTSWQQGLQATVQTLEGGGYSDILKALESGHGFVGESLSGLYTWSGHSYSSVG